MLDGTEAWTAHGMLAPVGMQEKKGVRTLGVGKVNDVAVLLEHVDLFNALDGLDIELLELSLELVVVYACRLVRLFDLAPGCAFAAVKQY